MVGRVTNERTALLRRPAIAVILFMLLVTGIAAVLGFRQFGSIEKLREGVTRANQDIEAATRVLDALQDAETGQRGFLLTMRPSYLEPYWASRGQLDLNLEHLQQRAKSAPWLSNDVAALVGVAHQKMAELDSTIQLALREGQAAALPMVRTDAGHAAMEKARDLLASISAQATAVRDLRTQELIERERFVIYGMVASEIAGVGLL